jgi:hypothetical protein
MRAISWILVTALAALWIYYGLAVATLDDARPVPVPAEAGEEVSAATLNNTGVELDANGRRADALAYLERAHEFRPNDSVIQANAERQKARVMKDGWWRALILSSVAGGLVVFGGGFWHFTRGAVDGARLARLRLRGDSWVRIRSSAKKAELPLRFTDRVDCLVRRHPLTIVWSSAAHGKHMKSRPPVDCRGRRCTVKLDGDRLARLKRYPGDWKAFLYLGETQVGETAARVG